MFTAERCVSSDAGVLLSFCADPVISSTRFERLGDLFVDANTFGGDAVAGWKASRFAVCLLILTAVHHAYGALVYHTPWRLHVTLIALPLAIAILIGSQSRTEIWRKITGALIFIFPVLLIGVFEGGYNHLLKNLVYFTAGAATTQSLFPPPTYELPNDWLFEVTGVAQFFLAPFAALEAVKMFRRPASHS